MKYPARNAKPVITSCRPSKSDNFALATFLSALHIRSISGRSTALFFQALRFIVSHLAVDIGRFQKHEIPSAGSCTLGRFRGMGETTLKLDLIMVIDNQFPATPF